MLPAVAASAYRIGSIIKFKGVDFLGSVDSIAKKTAEKMEKNSDITKDIASNLKSIGSTQKKIDKSKDVQAEILERQEKFIRNTNSKPKQERAFGNVFKAIIQKPVEALQKLLLGLLIALAPKVIKGITKFVNQVKLIGFQFKAFMSIGYNIIANSIAVVKAVIQNNASFDFTDRSNRLRSALDQWERDFNNDFDDLNALSSAWQLGPKELDDAIKALESGEDPRSAVQPQTPAFGSQSGGATVNGTAEEYRIAAAIATEAGRGQSATDVLQVAANRVADSRYPDNFTDVFAQPGQFQGVFDRGLDNYRNINSAEDAAAFSGRSVEQINGYIADMRSSDFRANSAEQVGGALEFRAAPQYYQQRPAERPPGTGADGRIPGSSWRGGRGDNQILRDPSQDPMRAGGAAPINYAQGGTSTPSSTGASGSITPTGNTTKADVLRKGDMVSGYQVTSAYGMRNHPVYGGQSNHGGLDIGTPTGTYLAFSVPVEIIFASSSGGYGYTVDAWAPSLGLQFRCAHLSSIKCRVGQTIPAGQCVARTGGAQGAAGSGTSTGPHLHFEVDTRKGGTAYGGSNDPNLLAQASNYLILSRTEPSKALAKLNINDIKASIKGNLMSSDLYYDYDEAERLQNQNTQVVMVTQPIVAKQTTVVNKTKKSGGTLIASGGGGGRNSAQDFNLNLLDKFS